MRTCVRWILTAFVIAAASAPQRAAAQDVPIGKKVHVTFMSGERQKLRLASLDTQNVILRIDGKDVTVPLRQVDRIERVSHMLLYSTLAGAALGFSIGAKKTCEPDCDYNEERTLTVLYGILGLSAGTLVGRTVKAIRGPSLVVYPRAPKTTVAIVPVASRGRIGLAGSITW
jgi:hypothetical protein